MVDNNVSGNNKTLINTGELYGKYSHPYGIVYNQSNIDIRKKTLRNLSFFKNINPEASILELGGTGQDAVAFAQMGFNTTYIDLSNENVEKTKDFIRNQELNLKAINSDFLSYDFKEKFDVIRSRGVIHHTLAPEKVFVKVSDLLKDKGYFHFNLYRSGTFYYWFVENIREISKTIDFQDFMSSLLEIKIPDHEHSRIGNHTIKSKSKFYNIIIDDLYVPILNPANYFDVIEDLKNISLEIIHSNEIKDRLNHDILYPDFPLKKNHIEIDCIKKTKPKIEFQPLYVLDQAKERRITLDDEIINQNNNLFKKIHLSNIKNKLFREKKFIKKMIILYKECYLISVEESNKISRHQKLNVLLREILDLF